MRRLRRIARVALRVLAGAIVLVVLAIVVAVAALHTAWGRDQVRGELEHQLDGIFVGGVHIGSVEGTPFGELVLRDVVIDDPDGGPAIEIATLRLDTALWPLLDQDLHLRRVTADGVTVTARRAASGIVDVAQLTTPTPRDWAIELDHLEVTGDVTFIDDTDGGRVTHVDDVAIAGALDAPVRGAITARGAVAGTWRERGLRLRGAFDLASDGDDTFVRSADATLGDLRASVRDLDVRDGAVRGDLAVSAPRRTVASLVPWLPVIGAVRLRASIVPLGPGMSSISLAGAIGGASLRGRVQGTPIAGALSGTLALRAVDGARIVPGAPRSALAATITIALARPGDAIGGAIAVAASGTVEGVRARSFTGWVAVAHGSAQVRADLRGDGGLVAGLDATADLETMALTSAHLVGRASDVAAAGARRVDLRGAFAFDLTAHGTPDQLAVAGRIDGRDVAQGDRRARELHVTIDAAGLPWALRGRAVASARGVVSGDQALGALTVTAATRADDQLAVTVRSSPTSSPWRIDLDGLMRIDAARPAAVIALGDHRIRTHGVDWFGSGGVLTIDPNRLTVADLHTTIDGGALGVDGSYGFAGDLTAHAHVTNLDLAELDRSLDLGDDLRGHLDGDVDLTRRRRRWSGSVRGRGAGVVIANGATPVDIDGVAHVRPGRVAIDGTLRGAAVGAITASLEIAAPRRIEDPRAWMRLPRSAIRQGAVSFADVDVAAIARVAGLTSPASGRLDGALTLTATTSDGELHARDVLAPGLPAPVDVDLDVSRVPSGTATLSATVAMRDLASARVDGTIAVPAYPFDPATWRALDADQIGGLTVAIDDLVLDPARSRTLGLPVSVHARGQLRVEVAPGLASATVVAELRDVRSGPLSAPVSLRVAGGTTASGLHATVDVSLDGHRVAAIEASVPVDLATLWSGGRAGLGKAPLHATLHLDPTDPSVLLAAFGRPTQLVGTVSGDGTVDGAVAAPVAHATLALADLGVTEPTVRAVTVDATWKQGTLTASLRADQVDGGALALDATVAPDDLAKATSRLVATRFDLAPLARLAPLEEQGIAGVIDGQLDLRGATTSTVRGEGVLHVVHARVPLGNQVGTMQDGDVTIRLHGDQLALSLDGKVGAGTLKGQVDAVLAGVVPTRATADVAIRNVRLIGELEPVIDGRVHATLLEKNAQWRLDVTVSDGQVVAPAQHGSALHPAGQPDDMVMIDDGRRPADAARPPPSWFALVGSTPDRPVLIVRLHLGDTAVQTPELRAQVHGNLRAAIGDDGIAITGSIESSEGSVAVFDRSYRIDRGALRFDGSADPRLDIQLVHDFPELTLEVAITGRLSNPDVALSSRPSTYSEGQLLSYLLGGRPGLQPGNEVETAATAIASALVSQEVGEYVGRYLPVQVDVLSYQAATTKTSAAVTVGKWLTSHLFVAYRQHLEARPDENIGEAELEYWLRSRVIFDGTVGDRGHHSADLLWIDRW